MAAKQKHRTAGNSYNLRRKVEIPIELQLNNVNAFLNEFGSQPEREKQKHRNAGNSYNLRPKVRFL